MANEHKHTQNKTKKTEIWSTFIVIQNKQYIFFLSLSLIHIHTKTITSLKNLGFWQSCVHAVLELHIYRQMMKN